VVLYLLQVRVLYRSFDTERFSCFVFISLQANKAFKRVDVDKKREDLEKVKTKFGLNDEKA